MQFESQAPLNRITNSAPTDFCLCAQVNIPPNLQKAYSAALCMSQE